MFRFGVAICCDTTTCSSQKNWELPTFANLPFRDSTVPLGRPAFKVHGEDPGLLIIRRLRGINGFLLHHHLYLLFRLLLNHLMGRTVGGGRWIYQGDTSLVNQKQKNPTKHGHTMEVGKTHFETPLLQCFWNWEWRTCKGVKNILW